MNKVIVFFLLVIGIPTCDNLIPFQGSNLKYNDRVVKQADHKKGLWGKYNFSVVEREGFYGNDKMHTYDFYKPENADKDLLPLIIFVHSGGFVTGDKRNYVITKYCQDFCRAGYATAAINYRLIDIKAFEDLRNVESLVNKSYTRKKIMEAVGDTRKAVDHFKSNSQHYGIDPEEIYLVGYSAGAIITNHFVFTNKREAKEYVDKGERWLTRRILGSREIDNIGEFESRPESLVSRVISLAGGILDFSHIQDQESNSIPLLMIHGTHDKMVPFGYDDPVTRYGKNDIDIDLAGFYFELGIQESKGEKITIKTGSGIHIPKWILRFIVKLFTTEVCGSGCIDQRVNENLNCEVLKVNGAPHVFMLNEDGTFNRSYLDTRNRILKFMKHKSSNIFF